MGKSFIDVIGAGFVGQATGKGFLGKGHAVRFVDVDEKKIQNLRAQQLPAYTPAELLQEPPLSHISILTVNTPTRNGKIELGYIRQAAADLGQRLKAAENYHLVVVRSTVLPGTTGELTRIIEEHSGKRAGVDFGVCMNPEFLRERTAEEDFAHPWLVVIGELDARSGDMLAELYADFACPIQRLSLEEAELQKYVHNLYNAVKITFFNEMRDVARQAGIDTEKVFPLVAKSAEGMWHPEYGIHDFGAFDGSCLPKDTQAFFAWAKDHGWESPLLETAIAFNQKLIAHQNTVPEKAVAQPMGAMAG